MHSRSRVVTSLRHASARRPRVAVGDPELYNLPLRFLSIRKMDIPTIKINLAEISTTK
jgi:hypothetical protein